VYLDLPNKTDLLAHHVNHAWLLHSICEIKQMGNALLEINFTQILSVPFN
jgi:hypothetical protein